MKKKAYFNLENKKSVGGKTGSIKVSKRKEPAQLDHRDEHWQYKPSIQNARWVRKAKASGSDRENFGEAIAATIGQALSDQNHVPTVDLVHDEEQHQIHIASKYLTGDTVSTLDDYAKGVLNRQEAEGHIQFVSDAIKPKQFPIKNPSWLKRELAKAIALSAVVGDHDVNPGNMMYIKDKGKERIARIDFGHAFNDLINTSSTFGGGIQFKQNNMIDFLNREKVGGLKLGARSKLWRDYPGLIPSMELVEAFREVAHHVHKIAKPLNDIVSQFKEIYHAESSPSQKRHILHSLNEIHKSITGKSLKKGLPYKKFGEFETSIRSFVAKNCADMKKTADLMALQIEIDEAIKSETLDKDKHNEFTNTYKLINLPNTWIKIDAKIPAFKGDLTQYIQERRFTLQPYIAEKQASIKLEEIKAVLRNADTNVIPQSATEKLLRIISNKDEKSTQQLRKLNHQLNKLTIDSFEPQKNSFFSKLIQQIKKMITPSSVNQETTAHTVTQEKRESFKQFKQKVKDISQSKLKADDKRNEGNSPTNAL